MSLRFAEFFAGIGLVRAGLARGGWTCAYANDVEPKKRAMYAGHFGDDGDAYHLADVRDVASITARLAACGPIALATASFPCVDLSLAGHWRGFAGGERSSTFFAFVEVLGRLGPARPPVVLAENVPGFLTSNGGHDFAAACGALAELGYWLDAFVIDARAFVPQSRPRVFLLGVDESARHAAAPAGLFGTTPADDGQDWARPAGLRAARRAARVATGWVEHAVPPPPRHGARLADVLDADDAHAWWPAARVAEHLDLMQPPSRRKVEQRLGDDSFHVGTAFRRTRLGQARAEVRFDVAGCLRTPKGGSARQIVVRVGRGRFDMRWMTAREYARLQGAPDYRIAVPEQQALYGFGDAVCVPVIEWVDRHVLTPCARAAGSSSSRLAVA